MTDNPQELPGVLPRKDRAANDELPFTILLCPHNEPERVLARAANSQLARAIYAAATKEHPEQRVVLRKGSETLIDGKREI